MSSLDDFADAIRGELSEMPVPAADEALLARVLESRRTGARVILPTDDPRRRNRTLICASAIAAAAVVAVLIMRRVGERDRFGDASDSWFVGGVAFAQSARVEGPGFAPALPLRAQRVHAMVLRYERRLLSVNGSVSPIADTRIDVARDTIGGVPLWRAASVTRVAAGQGGGLWTDSMWMSIADLAPVRRVVAHLPYSRYERILVEQHFNRNHVAGDMHAWQNGAVTAHRTFDRVLPDSLAPYVADAFAPLYLMAVPLHRNWEGSLSLLGWLVRDDDRSIDMSMRVEGEDVVLVPAGRFACWRLAATLGARRVVYWVRKDDGVGVRMLDSSDVRTRGVREMLLR